MADDQLLNNVPPSPRTPTKSAYELIYKYQGTQKITLIIGISFLLTGILYAAVIFSDVIMDLIIDFSLNETTGIVTELDVYKSEDYLNEVSYSYNISNKTFTGTSSTYNYSFITDYMTESEVIIEYSGFIPSLSRIKGLHISEEPGWRTIFLIFPVIGFLFTIAAVTSNRKEKKAYKSGIPGIAKIVLKDYDYSASRNYKHPFIIVWEFSIGGEKYTGSLTHMNPDVLLELILDLNTENESILIVYLENKPNINVPYI